MTDSFTIAHIADLHLSGEHKRSNLRRARRLLEAPQLKGKRKIVLIHHHFHKFDPQSGGRSSASGGRSNAAR